MVDRLEFASDGRDWPNREASRFVTAGGLEWHVQVMGSGPPVLLIHGTGASSHSWRDLLPILAARMTVIAPDLPGHGFTEHPADGDGLSLPGMARGVSALLARLNVQPRIAAGHSAGAAVLARMALDNAPALDRLISLNGALLPLSGLAGSIFSPIAKALVKLEFIPRLAARRNADPAMVARLVANTGSRLDARGRDLYGRLARNPGHVSAALGMMANWDLAALEPSLAQVRAHVVLVASALDKMISPNDAFRLVNRLPDAEVVYLRDLGHLAHEERPAEIAALILRQAEAAGILPGSSA